MKPTRSILSTITALLFTVVMGLFISSAIGIPDYLVEVPGTVITMNVAPMLVVAFLVLISLRFGSPGQASGMAFVGVNKEIWLPEIMEGFYPDTSFLSASRDMSSFVENDKINIAEAGVDPDVFWNNAVWPIPIAQRVDVNHALELGTLDSENTKVRRIEAMEAAYDKMASVAGQHRKTLMKKAAARAAFSYGPQADSADTPIITTTGAAVGGLKVAKLNDIIDLADKFDGNEWHGDRILLLHSKMANQLRKEDLALFKAIFATGKKQGFDLFGFTTFIYNGTPIYDHTTNTKNAFEAAPGANDAKSSIAYLADEVMRADGSLEMFLRERDPEERADILGFQKRFLAIPIRNKTLCALHETP